MFKRLFGFLQKVGAALMVPVAVLPAAGLLLGFGAAKFSWLPTAVSSLMEKAGVAIFATLPLLFAIAIVLSFADDVAAAVSAVIGFGVLVATMGAVVELRGLATQPVLGIPSLDTGVFGGILAGATAAALFRRYHRISLPESLSFFAGKRFVPMATAGAALLLGVALAYVWPEVQKGIGVVSHWAAVSNSRTAATVYGFVERLLVPFGLHHIWNVPFFFEIGTFVDASGKEVHGDIARFFAGDRTAGILAGAYFFKMFGLPGAAIAIWRAASPEHRLRVGGTMLTAALTSFLTGITEPIEFAFLFVAPPLYLLHAVLVATGHFVANSLDLHLGFTFSQGAIDLVAFNLFSATSQRAWVVLLLGPLYGFAYYGAFRFAIRRYNLRTPGREPGAEPPPLELDENQRSRALVAAFGGEGNITGLDACVTRLRITVKDPADIDEDRLKALGATAVMVVGDGVQAIFGPSSESLKSDLEAFLRGAAVAGLGQQPEAALTAAAALARIAQDHGTLTEDLAQARKRESVLQRNLEHGRRLVGLGGVVSGVAHDLRTPITGIKLTLDGLARRRLDEQSTADVQVCLEELDRLDRLIGQLMVVARSGAGDRSPVALGALVDERLARAHPAAEQKGLAIARHGDARLECSPDALTRVLDNLIANAIDASPRDAAIDVRIDADANETRVVVEDRGPGVPAGHVHELFEPFFTLKRQGTGLGLFLSHALVVVQGGRLSYERRGDTTAFTVGLPTHPERGDGANPGR